VSGSTPKRPGPRTPAPHRLEEALLRVRDHARAATAEAALAARALLDAASLGATGVPAEGHEPLRGALRWLEDLAANAGGGEGRRWLSALSDALDAEIARWEARSRSDPEARGVLRAFLGLRELLWELGLQAPAPPEGAPAAAPARAPTPRPATRRAASRRLERVPIDGGDRPGRTG
jgi:hypothetical protein